ncbi:unnamed protein product [Staurois parvus]|uniref:Uncharacterized protein n=1 Tax=Staurois parvus TaxID=386267 RepID=A0ABN9EH07_9NEOB|nr:unnamed protein product [Staurois parvus]
MCGSERAQHGNRRCAVFLGHSGLLIHRKSRRCQLGHVISCVQSQLITSVPPVSVHLSCLSVPPISASQCRLSVPVSVTHQCHLSVLPVSAHQC